MTFKERITRSMDMLMIRLWGAWEKRWVRGIACIALAIAFLYLYGLIISLLPVVQWPVGR